jgi:2-iminobutanoate/2-iminopropanoate deaminase
MTRHNRYLVLIGLAALFASAAGLSAKDQQRRAQFLDSAEAKKLRLPFSEAVRAGDMLYLSGQIGNLPGELAPVPGGIVPESRQALDNIKHVLEKHGSAVDEVIKCTVFLANMAEWPKFNEVYREYFKAPYPARSAVGVNGLALGARVEIECLAYSPQ